MTIVVYRDGVMASDSGVFSGPAITGSMTKVVRTGNGVLIGTAGRAALCEMFQDWASRVFGMGAFTDAPRFRPDGCEANDGRLSAIVVLPTRKVIAYHQEGFPTTIIKDVFFVVGAAEDIAIGALEMGADAVKAVEICISRHTQVVGPVQVAYLDDRRQIAHERGNDDGFSTLDVLMRSAA